MRNTRHHIRRASSAASTERRVRTRSPSRRTIAPVSVLIRRFVVWAALALSLWGAALYATGGFRLALFLVSRHLARSDSAAGAGGDAARRGLRGLGRRQIDDELERSSSSRRDSRHAGCDRRVCWSSSAGLAWGTFAASGVDAYGYVSEAALVARGSLRIDQPFVASTPVAGCRLGVRADGLPPCGRRATRSSRRMRRACRC